MNIDPLHDFTNCLRVEVAQLRPRGLSEMADVLESVANDRRHGVSSQKTATAARAKFRSTGTTKHSACARRSQTKKRSGRRQEGGASDDDRCAVHLATEKRFWGG